MFFFCVCMVFRLLSPCFRFRFLSLACLLAFFFSCLLSYPILPQLAIFTISTSIPFILSLFSIPILSYLPCPIPIYSLYIHTCHSILFYAINSLPSITMSLYLCTPGFLFSISTAFRSHRVQVRVRPLMHFLYILYSRGYMYILRSNSIFFFMTMTVHS